MSYGNIKLNDGTEIPAIAFGTGSVMKNTDVTEYVEQALESGFSHIDTAQYYATEQFVGKAIKESGFARKDLFITTKWGYGSARAAIDTSLQSIGVKQVDLYLIHNPSLARGKMEAAWREIESFQEEGLTKSIGVSNFTVEDMQELLKVAKIKPVVNQVQFHPYNWSTNKALWELCTAHNIVLEAYGSLNPITQNPGGPVDAPINAAAKRIDGTPAQVIFSWVKSKGVVIVTTTSKKERLQEYLDVPTLPELTDDEIAAIEAAGAKGPSLSIRYATRVVYCALLAAAFYVGMQCAGGL